MNLLQPETNGAQLATAFAEAVLGCREKWRI